MMSSFDLPATWAFVILCFIPVSNHSLGPTKARSLLFQPLLIHLRLVVQGCIQGSPVNCEKSSLDQPKPPVLARSPQVSLLTNGVLQNFFASEWPIVNLTAFATSVVSLIPPKKILALSRGRTCFPIVCDDGSRLSASALFAIVSHMQFHCRTRES